MDKNSIYYRQVQLLIRLLPVIAQEKAFALKGGTAINLFVRDFPRLSVDIDLTYLPLHDRDTALKDIDDALARINSSIKKAMPEARSMTLDETTDSKRIRVEHNGVNVKVELSPVMRGVVYAPAMLRVRQKVEEQFGFAEMQVVSLADLYAGKICAALDRQHPRDLFDIKLLLENEGITDEIRKAFIVYLISHPRPIAEVIRPRFKDIRGLFEKEFASMTPDTVTAEQLEATREALVALLHAQFTADEKRFLISFKSGSPQWELLGLKDIGKLPAVRWKMMNLEKMSEEKHKQSLQKLEEALG